MNGTVTLRPARAEDAVPCARILGDWVTATTWLPRLHTGAEDLAFLRHLIGAGQVTVADRGGVAVGYLARDGRDLKHLYLAPEARGAGIGSRLLHAAQAASDRLTLWCFQANEGARRFYERHGFRATTFTDGADNEEGVPDVRYDWEATS